MARAAFEDNCGLWTGIEGSALPQAGHSLPNIWKLATQLEAQAGFVTEMPATEEQAPSYEARWEGIATQNHYRVPGQG